MIMKRWSKVCGNIFNGFIRLCWSHRSKNCQWKEKQTFHCSWFSNTGRFCFRWSNWLIERRRETEETVRGRSFDGSREERHSKLTIVFCCFFRRLFSPTVVSFSFFFSKSLKLGSFVGRQITDARMEGHFLPIAGANGGENEMFHPRGTKNIWNSGVK